MQLDFAFLFEKQCIYSRVFATGFVKISLAATRTCSPYIVSVATSLLLTLGYRKFESNLYPPPIFLIIFISLANVFLALHLPPKKITRDRAKGSRFSDENRGICWILIHRRRYCISLSYELFLKNVITCRNTDLPFWITLYNFNPFLSKKSLSGTRHPWTIFNKLFLKPRQSHGLSAFFHVLYRSEKKGIH